MKNILYPAILCLIFSAKASAAIITAVANGNWIASSTWDAGRAPADNDQVIIPASKTVAFNGSPYPKNTPSTRPTLTIKIYGILDFSTAGNDKLYLDEGSTVQIYTNGKIQTTTSSTEIIAIYNGSTDNTVWTGTPAVLDGPLNATATSSGFANGILPVKFESFSIKKDNKGFATLSWVTSSEINSSRFEIERSSAESVNWQFAGDVDAAGNSSIAHHYQFTAPLVAGENRFRLKQIDIDGKYTYSIVVSIRFSGDNNISITFNQRSHQLSVKGTSENDAKIHIFDASGNNVYTGSFSAPVIFQPATTGVYVVNVINHDSRVAKKIMVY